MIRMLNLLLLAALLLAISRPTLTYAAPPTSAWDALPPETVGAMRMPDAQAFVQALRERTRFGQIALSEGQLQSYGEFIRDSFGNEWGEFRDALNRFGLEPDDWSQLFAGPAGLGVTVERRPDGPPLAVMLLWAEPGEDLAARLVLAAEQAAAEAIAEGEDVQRFDSDVAGVRVMHLSFPEGGFDYEPSYDFPDDAHEWSEQQWDAHFEKQNKAWEDAEWITVDRTNLMVAQLGDRLVAAITPPQSKSRVRELLAEEAPIDWDRLTGTDTAMGTLARFIERQQGGARGDGFGQRMTQAAGMERALGAGHRLMEGYVDVPALLEAGRLHAAYHGEDHAEVERYLQAFGVDRLGALGVRMALDGYLLRTGVFLTAPSPRAGLVSLMDQPHLPPHPVAWAGTDMHSYTHFSLDLGQVYDMVHQLVVELAGDEGREGFQQVEQYAQMFLQSSPREILASLGSRHVVVEFTPQLVEVEVPDWEAGFNADTGEVAMTTAEMPQQRMAYVWQLQDEGVWQRIFQALGGFVAMAGDAVQPTQEQGFTGFRMEEGGMTMTLLQGRGHLVLAQGQNVAPRVLAMLNNPPQGEASLAESTLQRRAAEVMPLRSSLAYNLIDAGRSIAEARTFVHRIFTMMPGTNDELDIDMERLLELVPNNDQLRESFGVSVGQGYVNDQGLVMENVLEMTPAH